MDTTPAETSPATPLIPLVIVEGFLSSHGAIAWGRFEEYMNSGSAARPVIFASVGPVSSLHDRACELFFELVGGTVDYGEEHAKEHGHARYGRHYERGLYTHWSQSAPLHFLGHSIGGLTIVKLQHLLSVDFWGRGTHPDMILSLNTISAPFRGTQLVYDLGERVDASPQVRSLSVGSLLSKIVHLVAYLSPILPAAFDLHTEARSLAYPDMSIRQLCGQLWRSDWAESRDATPFDVTFRAADEREQAGEGRVHGWTYYRSHAACMTKRRSTGRFDMTHVPQVSGAFTMPLYLSARAIGRFDFSVLRPIPSFVPVDPHMDTSNLGDVSERGEMPHTPTTEPLGEEYWANDGVVPLFSQRHPYPCSETSCCHDPPLPSPSPLEKSTRHSDSANAPRPGIWYVHEHHETGHMSLVPFWLATAPQKLFWEELGVWLRAIDRSQH